MALENTMTLSDRLSYLNLSDEESQKAISKFLATLGMLEYAEFIEVINRLNHYKIEITRAKDIKVIANGLDNIEKKINILDGIHEVDVYRQDPSRLNCNEVLKLYQRIQKCKQSGIKYKREDGTYENFLFDERLWQQQLKGKIEEVIAPPTFKLSEEDMVTLEPDNTPLNIPEEPVVPVVDEVYMNIEDYVAQPEIEEPEAHTTTFEVVSDGIVAQNLEDSISKLANDKKTLENFQQQLSELDTLKNQSDFGEEISFDDLEPDSFGGLSL